MGDSSENESLAGATHEDVTAGQRRAKRSAKSSCSGPSSSRKKARSHLRRCGAFVEEADGSDFSDSCDDSALATVAMAALRS